MRLPVDASITVHSTAAVFGLGSILILFYPLWSSDFSECIVPVDMVHSGFDLSQKALITVTHDHLVLFITKCFGIASNNTFGYLFTLGFEGVLAVRPDCIDNNSDHL